MSTLSTGHINGDPAFVAMSGNLSYHNEALFSLLLLTGYVYFIKTGIIFKAIFVKIIQNKLELSNFKTESAESKIYFHQASYIKTMSWPWLNHVRAIFWLSI